MFNSSQIKDLGLVGWRESTISGIPVLTSPNKASSSGMYYNDFSSLVTVQNVYKVQEDADISDANFNTFLTNLTNASFVKVLNAIFQDEDYLENRVLFPYENVWTETLDNDTSFVGFEIKPANRRDLIISLNNVFTSFTASDTIKLLLFHSSKKAAIDSKEIPVAELTDTDTELNWNLSNFTYSGGKFYVGYLRSGLTAKAINRDWNSANVQSCYNMFRMQPISVSGWDVETLFDIDDVEYESDTYGLNLDITSWKDYTNIILKNRNKFVTALGLQVASDVLELTLRNTQSNNIERELKNEAFVELEGFINADLPRTLGIAGKLKNEIARIRKTFVETSQITRGTL